MTNSSGQREQEWGPSLYVSRVARSLSSHALLRLHQERPEEAVEGSDDVAGTCPKDVQRTEFHRP